MGVRFDRGWVDPTDVDRPRAVNQIDAAVSSVTEDHQPAARHVELHHGFADREAASSVVDSAMMTGFHSTNLFPRCHVQAQQ